MRTNGTGFSGALVKPVFILLALLLLAAPFTRKAEALNPPDEGLWLPFLVQRLNYTDMHKTRR